MSDSREPLRLAGHRLDEIVRLAEERRLPPVHSWNPQHCGHSGMRIARDGTWYHEGEPIRREPMVRLFSTILRREKDGSHVLVTPAEKLTIDVELAPFMVTAMTCEGEGRGGQIGFELNHADPVVLGPDHPLRLDGEVPLLTVRDGLEASFSRPVYYELAELALSDGADPPGLWSRGAFFPLAQA